MNCSPYWIILIPVFVLTDCIFVDRKDSLNCCHKNKEIEEFNAYDDVDETVLPYE